MGRTKHKKLAEVRTLKNVFNFHDEYDEKIPRGYFGNGNTISLEIGCGHGDYTLRMAEAFPSRNFIGIDIKGARVWAGAKKALSANLKNAAFILCYVEKLNDIFINEKAEEIYIPFPDPHVRRTSANRRLISPVFIERYKKILAPGGTVHFKTDNEGLFEYGIKSLEDAKASIFKITPDLYSAGDLNVIENIQTRYEQHYINEGRKIKYIAFGFD